MPSKTISWTANGISIPGSAVNYALAANGAHVKASASSMGFTPEGVINGSRSLKNWGRGNGWQAPTPAWHPNWWGEWIEVAFQECRKIDTIVIYTFPSFVKGRLWRGLKDFQVQCVNPDMEWITLETVRNNDSDCRIVRFHETEASAIRIIVTGNHYPEEKGFEYGSTHPDESPRILEVEAYRLGDTDIVKTCIRNKTVETGVKGTVALFSDNSFARPFVSPAKAASVMRSAGYGVTLLDADEVCEPEVLNAGNFDIFMHPYGKYVPAGINLFDFLQQGGHLITFGGRAFTAVKQKTDGSWCDLDMDPEITASSGRYNDSIRPYREQLGIFCIPNSRFRHAAGFKTDRGQHIIMEEADIAQPVEGWMAYGLTGELLPVDESAEYAEEMRLPGINHNTRQGIWSNKSEEEAMWGSDENSPQLFNHPCARWIPLLSCYDAYGRNRGPAGALLMHYEGIYRGSNWAFFGIENSDLLDFEKMDEALIDVVDFMQSNVCLHGLEPDYACYRQGEVVRFSVNVDNCSKINREIVLKMKVRRLGENEACVHMESYRISILPGKWTRIASSWKPESFDGDLYRISAAAYIDGRLTDEVENGFAVWNNNILKNGPNVEFKDNYFHFDGIPRYVVGARDSGLHLPGQPDENALGWDRQYGTMRDYGMRLTSPIHIDWYIPGIGWGRIDEESPIPEVIIRRMEAQAQLAQKHGLIYAPGLFFAYENQAIKNLEVSRIICEEMGRRFKDVPGIIIYLLDDCLKHTPEVFNRWVKTCVDALNSCGRTYIVTAEFGFRQEWPDALRHGCRHLSFNAGSCFQRTVGDPVYDRLVDMRPAGKSFTYGEFVRRIPGGTPEDFHGYLAPPHVNFGMGYAMALNWKWHTGLHTIWPSDVIFPDNKVPKDHLPAFRNEALFFGRFKPVYRTPRLLVVMPSGIWIRNTTAVTRYLVAFLRRLIEMKVDFACIDDTDLDLLSDETAALIYPIPMEMTDEIYSKISNYVKKGGSILITGDISRAADDKPKEASRTERLTELCGLTWKGYAYAPLSKGHSLFMDRYLPKIWVKEDAANIKTGQYTAFPWINVEAGQCTALVSDDAGQPMVASKTYGEGKVWFTQDVNPELPYGLLAEFLAEAGIRRNKVFPDLPTLHCFKTDTQSGSVYTLLTFPWDRGRHEVSLETDLGAVRLVLREQSMGIIHVDFSNGINALETQGNVTLNGSDIVETDSHIMLSALDNKDLRYSSAVVTYPISSGRVRLTNSLLDSAEAGEIVNGSWHPYEMLETFKNDGYISFEINPLRSTALILLYEKNERNFALQQLLQGMI